MENFNKNSLKAAVAKYGPLHSDGKTDAEVKAELAKDERGFTAEQIDEIYSAIVAPIEDENPDEESQEKKDNSQDDSEEKIPEWAIKILTESFAPLFQEVKDAIVDLKKSLAKSATEATPNAVKEVESDFDSEAKYVVAEGKSFKGADFSIEYKEGEDVMHLDVITLKRLYDGGFLVEA